MIVGSTRHRSSTSIVELVISLEEEFGVRFSDDEIDLRLFQDLARLA